MFIIKFIIFFYFLFFYSSCNNNKSEEEMNELWSKAQTKAIIERSGTKFNSGS